MIVVGRRLIFAGNFIQLGIQFVQEGFVQGIQIAFFQVIFFQIAFFQVIFFQIAFFQAVNFRLLTFRVVSAGCFQIVLVKLQRVELIRFARCFAGLLFIVREIEAQIIVFLGCFRLLG